MTTIVRVADYGDTAVIRRFKATPGGPVNTEAMRITKSEARELIVMLQEAVGERAKPKMDPSVYVREVR